MNDNSGSNLSALAKEILDGLDRRTIESRLAAAGFHASPQLASHIEALAKKVCSGDETCALLASVLPPFLASPHPESACRNLLRYLENRADPLSFLHALARERPVLDILSITFGSSQYMADILIRNPGTLYWLIERQVWERDDDTGEFERELRADTSSFTSVRGKTDAIKRFHRRMLLKIGVQDLLGQRPLEDTIRRLSNLADAVVATGLRIVWEEMLEAAYPPARPDDTARREPPFEPPVESGFAVIAMGKLGGRELNYSSDIDLIYLCEDVDDEALGFYRIVAERLTTLLSEATEEGYLYRVDLRLRPDGETGPLVNTMESMRVYYESRGKPWEFQAYLKSRVIAGDRELGERCLARIAGLMFSPSLSYSPVETIALVRTRIQEAISDHDRAFNIKLMEGGIRDIEFIVQTIQLLHGTHHKDLRTPTTIEAIERIGTHGLLQPYEAATLLDAYRFFRLVEHRLQMMHQIKTHSVPGTGEDIEILARRVSASDHGELNGDSFLNTLSGHLNKIRVLAESFFAETTPPETSLLLMLSIDDPRVHTILDRFNLPDARQALRAIHAMAYGAFPRLFDRQTRIAFERLLPHLLENISRTGDPGLTLTTIANIAASRPNQLSFYRFLLDHPPIRGMLSSLAGLSSVLSKSVYRRPDLLERLLLDSGSVLADAFDRLATMEEASPAARDSDALSAAAASVAQARRDLELAAALQDIGKGTLPDQMQNRMTAFARKAMRSVFERMIGNTGAALFALGSYGVGEPRLRSDIDVLVAVDFNRYPAPREELIKTAQRLNALVTDSDLFRLDFRLRGEGANAPLVQGITFYKQYFTNRIAPWEKIAFAKCRFWGGDEELGRDFLEHLADVLRRPFTGVEIAALIDTRRRIEARVSPAHALYDTKRARGGRYDIEYLCGAALAGRADPVPFSASTAGRLEMVRRAGFIGDTDLEACLDALRLYAALEFCMELQGFSPPHSPERRREIERYLDRTFDNLGILPSGGIERSLEACKERVRACYDSVFDRLRRDNG